MYSTKSIILSGKFLVDMNVQTEEIRPMIL